MELVCVGNHGINDRLGLKGVRDHLLGLVKSILNFIQEVTAIHLLQLVP